MKCAACGFDERGVYKGKLEGEDVWTLPDEDVTFVDLFLQYTGVYKCLHEESPVRVYLTSCPKCKTVRLK